MPSEKRYQPYRDFPPVEPIPVDPERCDENGREKLSQTFLRHYENCPRSAYLYMKYRGGASSHPLERGSLYHLFHEKFVEALLDAEEPEMSEEQTRELMEHLITTGPHPVPFAEVDSLFEMAWHTAQATYVDPHTVIANETPFELRITPTGADYDITVRGRIDFAMAVNAVAEVIDYKTRWQPSDTKALKTFQLVLYTLAVAFGSLDGAPALDHLTHFRIAEEYPRHLWTEQDGRKVLAYREAWIDRERVAQFRTVLEGELARVMQSFETWDFPAIEGEHCNECPCRAECPIPSYLRRDSFIAEEQREIESAEQAAEVASRRFFMQEQLKSDLAALKAWANRPESNGQIRFGKDLILEWNVSGSKSLTKRKELEADVARVVTFGGDFNLEDYFVIKRSTSLSKRVLSEDELAEEAQNE